MPWEPGKIPEPHDSYQRSLAMKLCLDFLRKVDSYEDAMETLDELGESDRDITFGLKVIGHLERQDKRMIISAFTLYMQWQKSQPWYD